MPRHKIDWLQLETEIDTVLRMYKDHKATAEESLHEISNIMGSHTERGYTLCDFDRGGAFHASSN